ncbi:cathepsin B, putative [Perkinsus marinus ATCC 50983]|uniref:Cathepsin B, putative n=1 Tax=Perkinsus marinus (strain ATCC 50983 / TXsc) TaxID=423536 RepID=C5K8G2_PERM5|nr:cathepsin B, putative [Perkinsus marinus ATCC 50983]EER19169.1 cathepsin B, putative [Perkinsus marinus ATCC 50983]|eukprot:XP_002787373.1 cathepsin B, putative [Perkinsus marinus ATCC 50983]
MSVQDFPRGCPFFESSDEEIRLVESTKPVVEDLPPEFDARQKFNYCRDIIGHVVQQPVPPCRTTCTNKAYKKSLEKDVHRAKSWRKVLNDAQSIKQEIFDNGPVLSSFKMYEDFRYYKSGVYVPTTKESSTSHSIKIIGWGGASGREYWLAVNSWNEEWGDHGLIKMAFGKNRLEKIVLSIEPDM